MNRAAKRRLERAGLSKDDLAIIKKVTVKESVDMYSAAVLLVLRDNWGFGKVRLQRFLGQVNTLFEDIHSGYLSLEDCKKVLSEECGINLR